MSEQLETQELSTLLALQPVYGSALELKAFDLLLEAPGYPDPARLRALNRLVVANYATVHEDSGPRDLPCLLKLDQHLLLDPSVDTLPLKYYILELSPPIEPNEALCQRLQGLAQRGAQLALPLKGIEPEQLAPLLELVHILRIDTSDHDAGSLAELVRQLAPHNLALLADHLSAMDSFRHCAELGFRYFRGDFLPRPDSQSRLPPGSNKMLLLRLLAELDNAAANLESFESLISQDAALSRKFLRAASAGNREISNLSLALAMLGTAQLRRWVSLFLLEGHQDKPRDLMRAMLVRGRMCETLAQAAERSGPVSYFIVGLLSRLDLLTELPLPILLRDLPFSPEIKEALLQRGGDMGQLLREVEAYEAGQFEALSLLPERGAYERAYRASCDWTRKLLADG